MKIIRYCIWLMLLTFVCPVQIFSMKSATSHQQHGGKMKSGLWRRNKIGRLERNPIDVLISPNKEGNTRLHEAVKAKDAFGVQKQLEQARKMGAAAFTRVVTACNNNGDTPFTMVKCVDILRIFLEQARIAGEDAFITMVNAKSGSDESMLYKITSTCFKSADHLSMLREILNQSRALGERVFIAVVNAEGENVGINLSLVIFWEKKEILEELLKQASLLGLDTFMKIVIADSGGGTPFHEAVDWGNIMVINEFLDGAEDLGADAFIEMVTKQDHGGTPIHSGVTKTKVLQLLLSRASNFGVDTFIAVVTAHDKNGKTPFHKAVWGCEVEVVQAFLKQASLLGSRALIEMVTARGRNGKPPIFYRIEYVQELMNYANDLGVWSDIIVVCGNDIARRFPSFYAENC